MELDGGVTGTLDIYAGQPRDWGPSEVAALQAYAGLVASLLSAATTAQVKLRGCRCPPSSGGWLWWRCW